MTHGSREAESSEAVEPGPLDQPVRVPAAFAESDTKPDPGIALCLSGGGYRAMLFHVGFLWRLNESGVLPTLARVSSVSGGSITAGVLAMNWDRLGFDQNGVAAEFKPLVVQPVREMARQNVDIRAVLSGLGLPFTSISDRLVKAYKKHLFGKATLKDVPENPRFIFNATNLESGVLMRMSNPYIADYRVGRINNPDLPLAVAVAASSAFPPFLAPCKVDLRHEPWTDEPGNDLSTAAFRDEVSLCDGGVYDNLGLETAWKRYQTILISDAGGHMKDDADPPGDWARGLERVLQVIDNQVRSLRKRQAVAAFVRGDRSGTYVGIRSHVTDYPVADPFPADPQVTAALAAIPTRLSPMANDQQERLINWGYVACDAGLRSYVFPGPRTGEVPYPKNDIKPATKEA